MSAELLERLKWLWRCGCNAREIAEWLALPRDYVHDTIMNLIYRGAI